MTTHTRRHDIGACTDTIIITKPPVAVLCSMDFRSMRRVDRMLTYDEVMDVLSRGSTGVLCVSGSEGFPYGVPMHYATCGNRILFHTSIHEGLLLESISMNNRASFTVVENLGGMRSRSAIAFGHVGIDDSAIEMILGRMIDKYVPEPGRTPAKSGIAAATGSIHGLILTVDHLSGKIVDKPEGR